MEDEYDKSSFFDVDHTLFSHRLNAIPESAKKGHSNIAEKKAYMSF